jgi:hypothetical protein
MWLERSRMPPALPSISATLQVNTMDLTTLITACTLTVDPNIMHALTWHQSGGEPWAFSVWGQRHPQVLKSIEDAVRAARDTPPSTVVIRVGLCDERGLSNGASSCLSSQVSSAWTSVSVTRRALSISNSTDQPAAFFSVLSRPVAAGALLSAQRP